MKIIIEDHQKKIQLNPIQIKNVVRKILKHEKIEKSSIAIVFVSYQRIKALNKKFLGREYSTDVLAFDHNDECHLDKKKRMKLTELCGDIFISTDAAIKNTREYATELKYELSLYVTHGLLHLLGYDDHTPKDVKLMRKKEDQIMKFLGNHIDKVIQ